MREVLYRGLAVGGAGWQYGYYFEYKCPPVWVCSEGKEHRTYRHWIGDAEHGMQCPIDKETLGQWTGLLDKNGKRVFEGDIVRDWFGSIYPVKYKEKIGAFVADGSDMGCGLFWVQGTGYEIIGNIHDNPELVETKR